MFKKLIIFLVLLSFIGCSNTAKKTAVLNKKYANHELEGIASFYGGKYNFRKTASGERFLSYKMTAAHKTLPFGLIVLVTNLDNGASVKVKINDRGPFIEGRIIDLSAGAFKKIAPSNQGLANIRIDVLNDKNLFNYKP